MNHMGQGPGAGGAARGALKDADEKAPHSTKARRALEALTVRVLPDGKPVTVYGRAAQTLRLLISARTRGFTSGEVSPLGWARRTSAYVHTLRRAGVPIITHRESTPDGSCVGRYVLVTPLIVVEKRGVAA